MPGFSLFFRLNAIEQLSPHHVITASGALWECRIV
jgi:hypothetical protein